MLNLNGKTVLIVDDASFMRKMIKRTLTRSNIKVVAEAANGIIALEEYKKNRPDFVTMDIVMPLMDGISALKAIKEYDPRAKIIMVSSAGLENMIREAREYGAKEFIIKPFKEEQVIKAINNIFSINTVGQ